MIREEVVKRCLLKVTNIYTFFIVDLRYKLLREGHSAIILVLNLSEPAGTRRNWKGWINWLFLLLQRQLTGELGRGGGAFYRFRLNAWLTGKVPVVSSLAFRLFYADFTLSSAVSFS